MGGVLALYVIGEPYVEEPYVYNRFLLWQQLPPPFNFHCLFIMSLPSRFGSVCACG